MKKKSARTKTTVRKHSGSRPSGRAGAPVAGLKLGTIRRQLLEMRDDLSRTVRKQQLSEAGVDNGDSVDQASQSIEKELLFELSDNERVTLDQIEAALRKIDKGTYGLCESCQKGISKARLAALPFARYCISCQSTMESQPELVESPVGETRGFAGGGEESSREF